MDVMEDITDLAFNLVFRHLKIKEFYLTCGDEPLTSVGFDFLLNFV